MRYPTTQAKTPYGEGVITFLPDKVMRFESEGLVVNRIPMKVTIEIRIDPNWSPKQGYQLVVNHIRRHDWSGATSNAASKVLDLVCGMLEKTYYGRPEVQYEVESVRLAHALDSVEREISRLEKKLQEARRQRFSLRLQRRSHNAGIQQQHDS